MDSVYFRLAAQVALTTWALAEIAMLLLVRGQRGAVVGTRWAILGLCCFASWMFLLSLSIYAVAIIPRASIVLILAVQEVGAAIGAWGWLIANARVRFKINVTHNDRHVMGK